jgi:hypothetical protein
MVHGFTALVGLAYYTSKNRMAIATKGMTLCKTALLGCVYGNVKNP